MRSHFEMFVMFCVSNEIKKLRKVDLISFLNVSVVSDRTER